MKRKILSFATGLVLMSTLISPVAALADEETTKVFSYETYSVSYEIKSSWDNNQIIEVTLTNTGDEPILNWALIYDAQGEINGIWNGVIFDSNESSYIIKNSGYNYEILPENSVTFGYTLSGDDLCAPESITLCSQREDVDAESYSVSLSVSDDWGSGFNGLITIENLSDRPIEAWRLGFDANFEISNVWNAQLLSSDNNSYSVCSDITTTPIGVGETKTFGFAAVKDQDSIPEITNTSLSEVAINADLTDHNDDSSEIDDSSSEYSKDSNSENDDSSETDSSDVSSESDSSDESSEYEEPVVRPQTYTYEVRNEDCAVDEITVSMETAGDLEGTTTIENIMDKDIMCSGVVGLFGEPFDIETSAEFSSAVLTFKVDKSMLGDTEFDNLLFLWYDEENENFVELDTEHDEENSTVSTTVTHFSKYMLVDGLAWYTNWQMISKEIVDNGLVGEQSLLSKPSVAIGIPTVYSDSSSDPVTVNGDGSISCKRIDAFRYIYESLSPGQNYSLNFSIYGSDGYIHAKRLYCDELENDGLVDKYLNDLGFEDWEERSDFFLTHLAFYTYVDYNNTHFDVVIILISDNYHLDDMYTVLLNSAHDNRFVFIDMRDVTDHYLINRAEATGGLYMKYSDHAMNYLRKILRGEARFEDYDNDGDDFSDLEEKRGLIYDQAGNKVKTYWQFPDSDFDDLDDNEEVDVELTTVSIPGKCGNPDTIKYYHKMYSKPMLKDSDGDGVDDSCDYAPLDAMSEDEKVVYYFFENAEDYEAAYLGDFCNRFECSPRLAIEYIDTFRKYNTHDFGIDELMQDLEDKGFSCDKLRVEFYNQEYQNYKSGTSFAELMAQSYTSWADSIKFFMGIWAFGISAERCKSLSKWDYTGEYKLSLEEEKNAVKLINYKRDGVLRGSLNGLTKDEKTIIN